MSLHRFQYKTSHNLGIIYKRYHLYCLYIFLRVLALSSPNSSRYPIDWCTLVGFLAHLRGHHCSLCESPTLASVISDSGHSIKAADLPVMCCHLLVVGETRVAPLRTSGTHEMEGVVTNTRRSPTHQLSKPISYLLLERCKHSYK